MGDDNEQPGTSSEKVLSFKEKQGERMKRLRDLHLKRNEARQLNHKEVVEEDKRNKLPSNWEARKRQAEWILEDEKKREEAEEQGEDYDRVKLLNVGADEAEMFERKKKKKAPDHGFADYQQATIRDRDRRRAAKVNYGQLSVMVNYMCDHREFACGTLEGAQGKVVMARCWAELKNLMEKHGPSKTVEQWKRTWKDLKMKVRAKNAKLIREREGTSNLQVLSIPLNDLEHKVLSIVGVLTSIPTVETPVLHTTSASDEAEMEILEDPFEVIIEPDVMDQTCSSHTVPETPPLATTPPYRSAGLREEINGINRQMNFHESRKLELLKSIADSLQSMAESRKESTTVQREILNTLKNIDASQQGIVGRLDTLLESTLCKQYNRLAKNIKPNMEMYEKQKNTVGEKAFYAEESQILHGLHKDSKEGIDNMVKDLEKQINKREKYSRRRMHNDDADIDYINERNMKFNAKLERFYGEYTTEIKQNLERGTAV